MRERPFDPHGRETHQWKSIVPAKKRLLFTGNYHVGDWIFVARGHQSFRRSVVGRSLSRF
jgi:hypothetical protein